ncbi:Yip1 family protein [Methanolobus sp.]|uniref:Yip1 family protein n=1 Tax=Methanolobus sp. TaxID=1874737 RepID=UPI0025EB9B46|nr:Yip1 family protein [Methanolobus sp.]
MLEIVTNPDSFFKRKMNEEIDFKIPLMIMGFVWLVGLLKIVVALSLFMGTVPDDMPDDVIPIFIGAIIIGTVIGFVGIFIMWLFVSGTFYVLSCLFHGKGSFKRVMEFFSYGFIPYIIDAFISSIYLYYVFSGIDFIFLVEKSSSSRNEFMRIFLNEFIFANLPLTVVLFVFSTIMSLLTIYIWIYGLKHSRNISLKNSVIAIVIPVAMYSIYNWLSLLLYLMEIYNYY